MSFDFLNSLILVLQLVGSQQRLDSTVVMIPIKNTVPDRIIATLGSLSSNATRTGVKGISDIRPDPSTNSIVAIGTTDGIKDLQEVVQLIDVIPKRLSLRFRLVRITHFNGKLAETVLSEGNSLVSNNRQLTIGGADQDWETNVTILPRIHGDGTVAIATRFALSLDGKLNTSYEPGANRVKIGQKMVSTFGDPSKLGNDLQLNGGGNRFKFGRAAYRLEIKMEAIKN